MLCKSKKWVSCTEQLALKKLRILKAAAAICGLPFAAGTVCMPITLSTSGHPRAIT